MVRRLVRYLAPHRGRLAAAVGAMLASTAMVLLSPWPLKLIVDNVVGQRPLFGRVLDDSGRLTLLAVAAGTHLLLAGLRSAGGFLHDRWATEVSQRAALALSGDLYAQVQRLSLRFHDRGRVGDMVTRITGDVDEIQDAFATVLSMLSANVVTLVGVGVTMALVDWRFALVSLIVLPPLYLMFRTFRWRVRAASRAVRASEGAIASLAQEVLSSIRVVKAFGQEGREQERFVHHGRSKVEASLQATKWAGLFSVSVDVTTAAGVALVLGYGSWRVVTGTLTLGQLLLFVQYLTGLYVPLRGVSRLTSVLHQAGASAERIADLFDASPGVPEAPAALVLKRARGDLAFDDVWFGYEPASPVLRGIDLQLRAGEALAVVGPTGSGKSTLISLVPRFYDPTRGRLLLDGIDLRDLRLQALREQISIVLQDPILFSGTIRENIAYGRPDASDRRVLEAARAAYVDEFVAALPDGYDTSVGERGVTLSGGQRQRIAIARGLLKDAPLLIMDEPTSSVDVHSEALILEALARLMRGRTVIIITHRQSTARLANRVVVLRHGAIVEQGTPEQLHTHGPLFRELYRPQRPAPRPAAHTPPLTSTT